MFWPWHQQFSTEKQFIMYLGDLIFISTAFVSPVLSSSVDLTLVAGLRRQTVILVTLHKLAWETWTCHTVTGWKQREFSDTACHLRNTSCLNQIFHLCSLTPVRLCRSLQDSHTGSLHRCWSSRRYRGCYLCYIHSHLGSHQQFAHSQSQRDTHTWSYPVCCSRRQSHTLILPDTRFHLQRKETAVCHEMIQCVPNCFACWWWRQLSW